MAVPWSVRRLFSSLALLALLLVWLLPPVLAAEDESRPQQTIIAAIPVDFPPLYSLDPKSKKPVGLAVDVTDALARRAGLKVEYRIAKPWDEIESLVLSGQAQVAPFRVINDRTSRVFIFTRQLDISPVNFIVRRDGSGASAPAPGAKVGLIKSSTAYELLKDKSGLTLVQYDDSKRMLFDLLAGQLDCVLTVSENFTHLAREAGLAERLQVIEPPVQAFSRGMALAPGQEELRDRLDQAIAEFAGTPESQEIYQRWSKAGAARDNTRQVVLLLATFLGLALAGLLLWHYLSLRQVNRRLTDSQAFLQRLMDTVPLPIFYKDAALRYLGCNRAYETLLGARREELVGKTVFDLWPAEQAEIYQGADLRLLASQDSQVLETAFTTRDGRRREVRFHKACFKDQHGQAQGILGVAEDVTESRQNERALKESEARYRALVEDSDDGIFLQRGNRIVFHNISLSRMLGYGPGELEGQEHWVAYYGQYQQLTRERAQARLRGQQAPDRYEVLAQRKDGSVFPAELTAKVINLDGEPGIQVNMRDISERRQAEAERMVNAERMEALLRLNQLRDASLDQLTAFALEEGVRLTGSQIGYLAFTNLDESVLTMHAWSKMAMEQCALPERFLSYPLERTGLWGEAVRRRQAVITNDYQADQESENNLPLGHLPLRRHMNVPVFDGQRIVMVAGVGNKDGQYDQNDVRQLTLLMEGMWRIVQRQRAEQERNELESQLRQAQKMEAIGTLAGGVAHDFNNILAAIFGYAEMALSQSRQGELPVKSLEKVLGASERAAELVRQILTFSRKVEVEMKPLDLNQEVLQAVDLLEKTIPKMIDIQTRLAHDLRLIKANSGQMQQVVINLVTNARDAMPQGGSLIIATQNRHFPEQRCLTCGQAFAGPFVELSVADSGQGMDEQTRKRIFDPFFTTKDMGKGTGLGLSTVYGIVTAMGGHILCESQPGQGATMKVMLPALGRQALACAPDQPGPAAQGGKQEIILLVDDEETLRMLGTLTLSRAGYQVLTAASGEEALEICGRAGERVRLVILDLGMPGMGGRQCLEQLRALHPAIKVIIASGYAVAEQIKALEEAGACGYLAKPFRQDDLLVAIRKALDA